MIEASEWVKKNPENYLHIHDPYEGDEALRLIEELYDTGAIKVEVTEEPGYSDDGEEEREQLYITLPESIPAKLLLRILALQPAEWKVEGEVLQLWWDNH